MTDEQASFEFRNSFKPSEKLDDYKWIGSVCKSRFEFFERSFKELDEKAGSVITFLGSGTGLYSFGVITLLSNRTVSNWMLLFLAPSFLLSLTALIFAIRCRSSCDVYHPTVEEAADYAHNLGASSEVQFFGVWEYNAERLRTAVFSKSKKLSRAFLFLLLAVCTLILPMLASIFFKV